MDVLKAAQEVLADRGKTYGPPFEGFVMTARMWSAFFGIPISAEQVAMAFTLNKIVRESRAHKDDNLIDIAGYAQVAADIIAESYARADFRDHARTRATEKDLVGAALHGTPFERALADQVLADRAVQRQQGDAQHDPE